MWTKNPTIRYRSWRSCRKKNVDVTIGLNEDKSDVVERNPTQVVINETDQAENSADQASPNVLHRNEGSKCMAKM